MRPARSQIDITPDILIQAYSLGLFPMAESATDASLFWVDPEQRGIFPLHDLVISRSLAKTIRADRFQVVVDRDFTAVIEGCAQAGPDRDQTWINAQIRALFGQLFASGHVHTVEAYRDDALVGGLYGLQIGGAFFGESMFHRATDASKVCLAHLAARLVAGGFTLLDTQFITPHLASLGAIEIPRATYRARLAEATAQRASFDAWSGRSSIDGATVLSILRGA